MIWIKHIFLSVIAMLLVSEICLAQTYTITPNDTLVMTGAMEDLHTLSIEQNNNSNDTLYMKWQKVSESVPANWEASVCDNSVCYTVLKDSGTTNPVFPNEYGFILLHVTPHVNYGTAVIRYAIWDIDYPSARDTLTFILNVSAASGFIETTSKNSFSIFPNPANEYIALLQENNTGTSFLIKDLAGREIESGILPGNSVNLSTRYLPDGLYTISIIEKNGMLLSKKLIIQH